VGEKVTSSRAQDRLLLAADVGGTKTDLAVISVERGPRQPLAQRRFPSQDHESLESLAKAFLDEAGQEVQAACLDVAGPVIGGKARLTNLPWEVSEASMAAALGIGRVRLLNDLVAVASAVPVLAAETPIEDRAYAWRGLAVLGRNVANLYPLND
jgi:glucokinase